MTPGRAPPWGQAAWPGSQLQPGPSPRWGCHIQAASSPLLGVMPPASCKPKNPPQTIALSGSQGGCLDLPHPYPPPETRPDLCGISSSPCPPAYSLHPHSRRLTLSPAGCVSAGRTPTFSEPRLPSTTPSAALAAGVRRKQSDIDNLGEVLGAQETFWKCVMGPQGGSVAEHSCLGSKDHETMSPTPMYCPYMPSGLAVWNP